MLAPRRLLLSLSVMRLRTLFVTVTFLCSFLRRAVVPVSFPHSFFLFLSPRVKTETKNNNTTNTLVRVPVYFTPLLGQHHTHQTASPLRLVCLTPLFCFLPHYALFLYSIETVDTSGDGLVGNTTPPLPFSERPSVCIARLI